MRSSTSAARARAGTVAAIALSHAVGGCTADAEPRPQLVVVVDTDAPTVGQGAVDAALSPATLIDTLSIAPLDAALRDDPGTTRVLVLPAADDWPLSFGVTVDGDAAPRLRLRAYRAASSQTGDVGATAELERALAIDRLVELPIPTAGVTTVEVVLSLECLGKPPSFFGEPTTCVDAVHRSEPIGSGVVAVDAAARSSTRAGTSPLARQVACRGPAPAGAVCIPGGVSILGSAATLGTDGGGFVEATPLKPVLLSPFWLDATEVTVGAFASVASSITGPMPGTTAGCTWPDGAADLPLSCVPFETAGQICAARGGELPTEAQWEHAARGHGAGWAHPWGDRFPVCCSVQVACVPFTQCADECAGAAPAPVGQHAAAAGDCPVVDRTPEGVVDLGGNVREIMRNKAARYDDPCWGELGLVRDPDCQNADAPAAVRGGSYTDALLYTTSSLRSGAVEAVLVDAPFVGVRCAYRDGP